MNTVGKCIFCFNSFARLFIMCHIHNMFFALMTSGISVHHHLGETLSHKHSLGRFANTIKIPSEDDLES